MKFRLLSMLLIPAIGASIMTAAHTQSGVTLYGLVDAGLLYNSNAKGGRQFAMNNSTLQGNRWGLHGSEYLGDGLATIFVLENGFTLSNGALAQGGAEFGRQAYVGLSSPYGSVTLGRQYDALLDAVSGYTFGNSTHNASTGQLGGVPGMHVGDVDNLSNTTRINNSIKGNVKLKAWLDRMAK